MGRRLSFGSKRERPLSTHCGHSAQPVQLEAAGSAGSGAWRNDWSCAASVLHGRASKRAGQSQVDSWELLVKEGPCRSESESDSL